jgi:hypothetical protein
MRIRNNLGAALAVWVVTFGSGTVRADVNSGPAAGANVPGLTIFAVTGASAGKQVAVDADRKGQKTVYVFIRGDQWGRPMGRFLKSLDAAVKKNDEKAAVIAVWLTADVAEMKNQLPRVQESLKFESTTLSVYEKDKNGPEQWGLNGDAHLTAVIVRGDKVAKTFGFVSVNDTLVPDVEKALKGE